MRLLLDTHAFLWFLLDDPRLSVTARAAVVDPLNIVEISPASYWEIAIKIRLRKYALPEPYQVFMEREIADNDFRILPIEPKHTALLTTMPLHHNDPFDRLRSPRRSLKTSRSSAAMPPLILIRSSGSGDPRPTLPSRSSARFGTFAHILRDDGFSCMT